MWYFTSIVIFILLGLMPNFPLFGEEKRNNTWIDAPTRDAIEAGLKYIVEHQISEEGVYRGSFREDSGDNKFTIAVTSFACLALMADGNLPGRGRYGDHVASGVDFILRCAELNKNGFITCYGDQSRIHGHGYATLLLAQVYGTSQDLSEMDRIRKCLEKSVTLIVKSQTPSGGWGYMPDRGEFHEGSTTVCQLQALRACQHIGILVPKRCIDDAVAYLRSSANSDGTFKYRLGMDEERKSFPLTAAGVASLYASSQYELEEVTKGLKFMMEYLPPLPINKQDRLYQNYYYYGQFYAAQAMYYAPSPHWEKWFPAVRDDLLAKQSSPGVWGATDPGRSYFGVIYATAIATLILQIPYNYLPIFQK